MVRQVRRPTAGDVEAAWRVIGATLAPTPVDVTAGPGLMLKLESLQPTGSFKVRGGLNALAALGPEVPVITASAGNHALGVAFAAKLLGRTVTVVLPENASPAKVAALGRFPATVVRTGRSVDEAEARAMEMAARGGYYLSPYNDPLVIAGQATVGCELAGQVRGQMTVVCGVGGGGLAAGLGLWASGAGGVRVVGVEAAASTAVSAAVHAGHGVGVAVGETLADGMAGNIEPGSVTVGLVADHVEALVTVTEDEIRDAIRYLARAHGVIAEGAGAAAAAAVLAGKVPASGQVVAVVSGRNISLPVLAAVLGGGAGGAAGASGPAQRGRWRHRPRWLEVVSSLCGPPLSRHHDGGDRDREGGDARRGPDLADATGRYRAPGSHTCGPRPAAFRRRVAVRDRGRAVGRARPRRLLRREPCGHSPPPPPAAGDRRAAG
ncbi:MAG: pyridoxal-phosphate dependent enzyme [Streptosporangiaceae bacterium]|nr:pyridoxal-phosphate dependent enzyme [Streptosporangiaceae bacterium]MBV9853103.1 pyridoxal-phosphate dependent enzyme [Streptosporangiaceae bacterium]